MMGKSKEFLIHSSTKNLITVHQETKDWKKGRKDATHKEETNFQPPKREQWEVSREMGRCQPI